MLDSDTCTVHTYRGMQSWPTTPGAVLRGVLTRRYRPTLDNPVYKLVGRLAGEAVRQQLQQLSHRTLRVGLRSKVPARSPTVGTPIIAVAVLIV